MFPKALVCVMCATTTVLAAERMSIAVCNLGDIPDQRVARAETEVAAVFSPLGIGVGWVGCEESGPGVKFILRLRREGPLNAKRPDSLDILGMAFTVGVTGTRVDAYYGAIEIFAQSQQADPAEVLGCVVAHELGHLLLGPGHVRGSIMSAAWDGKTLMAVRQRWLTFNKSQRAAIHRELQARTLLAGSR